MIIFLSFFLMLITGSTLVMADHYYDFSSRIMIEDDWTEIEAQKTPVSLALQDNCILISPGELTVDPIIRLERMKNLHSLDLTSCEKIPTEIVSRLEKALPECVIYPRKCLYVGNNKDMNGYISDSEWEKIENQKESFNIYLNNVTDVQLKRLAQCPFIRKISISGKGYTDEGLKYLAVLPKLYQLEIINNNDITDAGIANLRSFPELRKLKLFNMNRLTSGVTVPMKDFPKLEELILMCYSVSDEWLLPLMSCKQLLSLEFPVTEKITDLGCLYLSGIPRIQMLRMKGMELLAYEGYEIKNDQASSITGAGIGYVVGIKTLRTLYLDGLRGCPGSGFAVLARAKQLRTLQLPGDYSHIAILAVGKLTDLETLILRDEESHGISDATLQYLKNLKKLRYLDAILSYRLTEEGLKCLSEMKKLRSLNLCYWNGDTEKLAFLAEMTGLVSLELGNDKDDSIKYLKNLRNLRDLPWFSFSDKTLEEMGDIKYLKNASLACSDKGMALVMKKFPYLTSITVEKDGTLTEKGLRYLANFKYLESLQLNSCIPEEGLPCLNNLSHLEDVQLCFSKAPTDRWWKSLTSLKQIKSLYIDVSEDVKLNSSFLSYVGQLENLTELFIVMDSVSEHDLRYLLKLKKLESLNVSRINAHCLENVMSPITEMNWLKTLYLPDGLSDDLLKSLQKDLPTCEINVDLGW